MKTSPQILAAVSLLVTHVQAHYSFAYLAVNGTYDSSSPWKYVRQPQMGSFGRLLTDTPDANTPSDPPNEWKGKPGAPQGFNPPKPDLSSWPLLLRAMPQTNKDVLTPNFRCGRDGWKPHSDTRTATVLAGDAVGFLPERYSTGTNQERVSYDSIAHIGPGMAYLAKKPDGVELSQWDGDGDWFKIDYTGPSSDESWVLLGAKQYNVTIPKPTPPGEYLLRVEHFYPSTGNTSEFFVNCAQINIIGPGGGTPTGFARFPGAYKPDEVALSLPEGEEIVNGSDAAAIRWKHGFLSYVPPGPPVWTG